MNTKDLLHSFTSTGLKYAFLGQVLLSILLTSCAAINNGEPAPVDFILICADYRNPDQTESKTGGIFTLDVNNIGSLTQLAETSTLYGFFKSRNTINDETSFSPDRTHLAYTDGETVKIIGFQDDNEVITTEVDPIHDMRWSDDSKTYMVVAFTKTVEVLGSKLPLPVYKYVDVTTGAESATDEAAKEFEAYNDRISPDGKYQIEFNDGNAEIRELKSDIVISEFQFSKGYDGFRFIAWSPDSKQLLFWIIESPPTESNTTVPNDPAFDWQEVAKEFARFTPHLSKATLFTVNIDGTQLTQLTAQGEVEPDIIPAWSPDSSRIIYGSWLSDVDGDGLAETERTYTSLILIDLIQNVSREVLKDSYDVTCVDW